MSESTLVTRLREHADCCDHEGLVADLRAAADLIARLPVTADGAPLAGLGPFTLWYLIAGEPEQCRILPGPDTEFHAYYSTRAAAESASAAGKGGQGT